MSQLNTIVTLNRDLEARKKAMKAIVERRGSTAGYEHLIESVTDYKLAPTIGENPKDHQKIANFIASSMKIGNTVILYYPLTVVAYNADSDEGCDIIQISPSREVCLPFTRCSRNYKVEYAELCMLDCIDTLQDIEEELENMLDVSGLDIGSPGIISRYQNVEIFSINSAGVISVLTTQTEADSMVGGKADHGFTDVRVFPFDDSNLGIIEEDLDADELFGGEKVTQLNKQENTIMSNVKANAVNTIAKNKSAALTVAKIEAGRIAIKQVSKVVTPKLPIMVRGYADTAVGRLVMANLFSFAVQQFASHNKNALLVGDAMLEGAMLEVLQSFNVEQLIDDVVNKVDVSKLVDNSDE